MPVTAPSFVVGIDLGTTHCAISAARIDQPTVRLRQIPQLVAPGQVDARPLLPSFLYLPAAGELASSNLALPWGPQTHVVGELARQLGAKVPNRLISSAKSWVCHGGVNRRAPILPWNAPEEQPQISPFEAQVAYLAHIRASWDAEHPDDPLRAQDVIVTVPASFDEGARELTTQAADAAGLGEIRVIEEPQAAFYDFLGAHAATLKEDLGDAKLILVVDVGGGTTDLTLLRVLHSEGDLAAQPRIERIAVGGHLMLGGDNMDAALASFALEKAGIERPGDASSWSAIVQSACKVKEILLAADAPPQATLSYQGRGSRLIGNTRSVVIEREEASRVLLDGFVPQTGPDEIAQRRARAGLTTLGLPYTSDTAIPRHICAFLRRHAVAAREAGARVDDGLPHPDLLLLNGGVFKAPAIVDRLSTALARWYDGEAITLLEHTSLDTAVAHGAVRSGLARWGLGDRIGGGTARAYYIAVADQEGGHRALCIAPRGMEDGASVHVPDRVFQLILNQPVSFPLLAYTGDRVDPAGALVDIDDSLDPLSPLETVLRTKGVQAGRTNDVAVTLHAAMTDSGALELALATIELPPRRWRLDLVLTEPQEKSQTEPQRDKPGTASGRALESAAQPPPEMDAARDHIASCLRDDDPKRIKGIRREIEKVLGPRGRWSAPTCRAVWEVCLDHRDQRSRSELHELNWLRLAGWGLRPGFGLEGDETRLARLWELRATPLAHPTKAIWGEWWILWRRVAAGLDVQGQRALFAEIQPWIWRVGNALPPGPRIHGDIEMLRLLATLERISPDDKRRAGDLFFARARKIGSYWPLGRIGARVPFHGAVKDVVDPSTAQSWLHRLLELDWKQAEGAAFAAASIARRCHDPGRDVSEAIRDSVAERLSEIGTPATWIDMVRRGAAVAEGDMLRLFGESLPVGLRLRSPP